MGCSPDKAVGCEGGVDKWIWAGCGCPQSGLARLDLPRSPLKRNAPCAETRCVVLRTSPAAHCACLYPLLLAKCPLQHPGFVQGAPLSCLDSTSNAFWLFFLTHSHSCNQSLSPIVGAWKLSMPPE
jgi:hypothetical protein